MFALFLAEGPTYGLVHLRTTRTFPMAILLVLRTVIHCASCFLSTQHQSASALHRGVLKWHGLLAV